MILAHLNVKYEDSCNQLVDIIINKGICVNSFKNKAERILIDLVFGLHENKMLKKQALEACINAIEEEHPEKENVKTAYNFLLFQELALKQSDKEKILFYVKRLKDRIARETMAQLLYEASQKMLDVTANPTAARAELIKKISEFKFLDASKVLTAEFLHDLEVDEMFTPKENDILIKTGFQSIDAMVNGITRGSITALLANTGHGKSTFATQFGVNTAREYQNGDVLYITLEMTEQEIYRKGVTAISEGAINAINLMLKPETTQQEKENYLKYSYDLSQLNFSIMDPLSDNTINDIIEKVKAFQAQRNNPLNLIIIDHWHLVKFKPEKGDTFTEAQNRAIVELSTFAKEYDTRVLILTQRDKQARKQDACPSMHEVKGTSGLGDICQNFWILHREEKNINTRIEKAIFKVEKARHGTIGEIEFSFNRSKVLFEDFHPFTHHINKAY